MRVAHRAGDVVRGLATCLDLAGQPGEIGALVRAVLGGEGDDAQAVVARAPVERDLADRLAIGVGADQRGLAVQEGREGVDHQFARGGRVAGADERDPHRRHRLWLGGEI